MNYLLSRPDFRSLVAGAGSDIPVKGRMVPGINFDNAATTPPFLSVLRELVDFAPNYASVHRGAGYKSRLTSGLYEEARAEVMRFVGGDPEHDICIFVQNTTAGINKLAHCLAQQEEQKKIILCSQMEHHSNDLPWRNYFQVVYVQTDLYGRLDLDDLQAKLVKHRGNIRIVAITGASNVTGYVNPIHKIAELAHRYHTKLLVDGAQLVPHCPVDMKPAHSPQHIDYLVFSAHKMYAPFGAGVLIGPKASFSAADPDYAGGGTVNIVTPQLVVWDNPPARDEAGTPNAMGVIALTAAMRVLKSIGMKNIEKCEKSLLDYLRPRLESIPGLEIYSCSGAPAIGVIPFNLRGIPHNLMARMLAEEGGIAVRNGCFCAQPYVQKLLHVPTRQIGYYMKHPHVLRPGMVRVSFGLYNTPREIDVLIDLLKKISADKPYYQNKYKRLKEE